MPSPADQVKSLSAEQIVSLLQTNVQLAERVASLEKQLAWFKNQVFGQTSEKRSVDVPGQGNLLGALAPQTNPEESLKETITYERKKPQKNRGEAITDTGLRFDETVEVEEIRLSAPELEGPEADQYELIDERITYRLAHRRSSYVVLKYVQPVVKHKPSGTIATKSAPTPVLEKSLADVSLLVALLINKFLYHQPLYRQHQKLLLDGITLSRTTLTNYVHRTAQLLEPIYQAMLKTLLQSKVLAMDETPTKAGRKSQGKMQQAWYWTLLGDNDEMVFYYSASRARKVVNELLHGFNGTLVTDGYGVYASYVRDHANVTHAQCWMHNRRGYFYAKEDAPEEAAYAMELIAQLYAQEGLAKERANDQQAVLDYRLKHHQLLVDRFFDWVDEQRQRVDVSPKSPLGEALRYSVNHEAQLRVFLGDPNVPLDTGAVERGLRPIPMGRRNWLFNWSEVGAHYTGIIQSLIVTCRMQGIHPRDYLVDVLQRIDLHPASKIDELTPSQWKKRYGKNFLTSDVD